VTEKSYWWTAGGGAGDGSATFTRVDLQRVAQVLAACCGFEGVAPGLLNELVGAVGGANTVNIGTGGGLVDGKPHYNDAVVPVTIPSAVGAGNTRIDRIVLRAGWTAQTVRITRIAGTDAASPTAPAITQTSGTTYDIMLYQALVNTSGTVTLTDERVWAAVTTNGIANLAVTAAKIAANAITNAVFRQSAGLSVVGRSANSTGDVADIAAANDAEVLRRSGTTLSFGTVATAGIADNAVTAAKIAAAVAGDGLTGGAGVALAVNPDGTTLEINSDAVRIKDLGISTAKLAANAVSNAKFRQSAGLSLVGRSANSTGDVADITGTDGQVARVSGAILGFGTIATAGLGANVVDDTKLRQGGALTVIGRSANSTGNVADIAAGSDGHVLRRSGTALGFGTVATAGLADGILSADAAGRAKMASDFIQTAHIQDSQVTAAKIADRTRSFLVAPTGLSNNATPTVFGPYGPTLADGIPCHVGGHFYLPVDYVSGLTISPVLIAAASGNIYAGLDVYHGAVGENITNHSNTVATAAIAMTANQLKVIAACTPTNIAAGDYFYCYFNRYAEHANDTINDVVNLIGFLVSYTADS